MTEVERRALSVPVEVREDDDGKIRVEGYAAVFDDEANIAGMFRERIAPGAFTAALERGDDVSFLINHEGLPMARTRSGTLKLEQDERGLRVVSDLDVNDPDVKRIIPKMKRGDLDKMSFAFIARQQEWDDRQDPPLRTVMDVELFDVSIVTEPAFQGTEIGLRSLEQHRKAKNFAAARLRQRRKLDLHDRVRRTAS